MTAGHVENRTLFPTEAGTPQGGIISPTLANLALDGLERLLKDSFRAKEVNGERIQPKVNLVRYADDFTITGATKDVLENEVRPLVEQFLRDRGLQLPPEKTCITPITQGFDFLGQNLRKFGDKLLIQPSKKNAHAFLRKVRRLIRQCWGFSQAELIRQLNPVIRGWANYHRHIVAARTYRKVDKALWQALWQWAKRRQPQQVLAVDCQSVLAFDPQWRGCFQDRAFCKWSGIHCQESDSVLSNLRPRPPRGF